jgi:hypothetical protein
MQTFKEMSPVRAQLCHKELQTDEKTDEREDRLKNKHTDGWTAEQTDVKNPMVTFRNSCTSGEKKITGI